MRRTLIALAISGTCLLHGTAAHAQRIAVSIANSGPWLSLIRSGLATGARQHGADLKVEDAQDDISRQINQIQNFIAQKADAIIVVAVDAQATPRITALASAARIPLVYVNHPPAPAALPPGVVFVGSDESTSGTLQAAEVCRILQGRGNVAVMVGELSNASALQRTRHVKAVLARPPCSAMKIVAEQAADWSRVKGADLMANWITAGLPIDAVIANNDEMAIGAIQSLKAARRLGKVVVAGVDATQDGLAAMKAGEMKVTVFQDAAAQGRGAVDAAMGLMGKRPVPSRVWVPFELVTAANLDKYLGRQ
jgi:ABC-type sugar transport system substrate-binding protein